MKKIARSLFFISLIIVLFPYFVSGQTGNPDRELVWSDEFNYTGLPDSTKWTYQVGGHGWGNHEKQYYTRARTENARVENGMLIIEARKENWDTMKYTSTRLVTQGKHDWLYGRFEIRARLPYGVGTWPAIWMMPSQKTYGNGGWPDNGEIDIMEHVGFDQDVIHSTTHTKKYYFRINTQRTAIIKVDNVSGSFHNYAIEWYPDRILGFVDDTLYFTSPNDGTGWEAWPFDRPFYLIMNIAVGGDWGGQKGVDDSIWPQRLEVDYVRVYQ